MPHAKLGFVPPSNTPSPTMHGNLVSSQADRVSTFSGSPRICSPSPVLRIGGLKSPSWRVADQAKTLLQLAVGPFD